MIRSQPEGFLAVPSTGNGPGVMVLHAWWGLNETMKDFCTKLAESGFTTFAPDLYHGKIAVTISEAEALGSALDQNFQQVGVEIAEAAMFLNDRTRKAGRGLAVIGFSFGDYYALDLAAAYPELIHSAIIYYWTGDGDYSTTRAAYLGHFTDNNEFDPQSNIDQLEESLRRVGRRVIFRRYNGAGHWFCEPDRQDACDEATDNLAWERTLAFLKGSSA